MKLWRIISLTLWGVVLTSLLLVSSAHYLLSSTVLDQSKARAALSQTGFYDVVRSQVFLPEVKDQLSASPTDSVILPSEDILTGVEQVFTTDKVRSITDKVLGGTYQWANKKAPSIEFSIPIASEKEALATTLEARIKQNVGTLPRCNSVSEIAEDVADATCLPPSVTAEAASIEAIDSMRNRLQSMEETVTPETLHLTGKDLGPAINAPDYFGYVRALNFITLPLAFIISLYLLFKHRGSGLLVIGLSLLAIGIVGLTAFGMLSSPSLASTGNALNDEIVKAGQVLAKPVLLLGGGAGVAAGAVAIIGGVFWQRASRKHRA